MTPSDKIVDLWQASPSGMPCEITLRALEIPTVIAAASRLALEVTRHRMGRATYLRAASPASEPHRLVLWSVRSDPSEFEIESGDTQP